MAATRTPAPRRAGATKRTSPSRASRASRGSLQLPTSYEPMHALLVSQLPTGDGWMFADSG